MRKVLTVLFLGAAVLGAAAASPLLAYNVDPAVVQDLCFELVTSQGKTYPYQLAEPLKAIPAAKQPEAAKAIGAAARSFFLSDAFKRRYAEWYKAQPTPEPVAPKKSLKELRAAQKVERDKAQADLNTAEAQIKAMPKEYRDQAMEALKAARAAMKDVPQADDATLQEIERARFDEETQRYNEALAAMPPKEPAAALRAALQSVLDATEGIDYAAETREQYERRVFVNADYESKPDFWKLGFRLGKTHAEAGRAWAKALLKDCK
jgi:hypothetical protein